MVSAAPTTVATVTVMSRACLQLVISTHLHTATPMLLPMLLLLLLTRLRHVVSGTLTPSVIFEIQIFAVAAPEIFFWGN